MKTGKKALVVIVVALVAYLLVGLCFVPRDKSVSASSTASSSGTKNTPADAEGVRLVTAQDSISFAASMIVAYDMPQAISDLEITPATIDNFVKGLCDAFPVDESPEAEAYVHGIVVGTSAVDMLGKVSSVIYQSDTTKRVDRRMFLEGLKAMAYGNTSTMTVAEAYDYYHKVVFRLPSEEFISKNKKRNGVTTLRGGTQVKIERASAGEIATPNSTVAYIYKASFINGNVVESSRGEVVEAAVNTLLPGLAEVMTTLPVGTKCKVYLPWQLAYGAKGSNRVPPYSALVYDVEIVKIVKK